MTNRTKAIIGLGSVFILGGLCGALIFGAVIRDRVHEAQGLRDQQGFISYFEKRLELTEAQRDSLHDELVQAYQQLADLRFDASMSYNAVIDSLRSRVYPHLTAEQQELFNAQEQKFRHFMPREPMRGPHGGGPRPMAPPPGHTMIDSAPATPPAVQRATPPITSSVPQATKSAPTAAAPSMPPANDAAAQPDVSPEERMMNVFRDRMQKVRQRLHLTDDQMQQVTAIFDDARTRVQKARVDYVGQPFLRKMTVRDIVRGAHQKVSALLTDDQRTELQKMRDEMKAKKLGAVDAEAGKSH